MANIPHYHSDNYPLKYNTDEFYQKIITGVSNKLGRLLKKNEKGQTINFIKKMDPDLFSQKYQKKTISIMVSTLVDEFKNNDIKAARYEDSQQNIRQIIGVSSESDTAHAIYDNPKYLSDQYKSNAVSNLSEDDGDALNNSDSDTTRIEGMRSSNNKKAVGKINVMPNIESLLGMRSANGAARVLNPKSRLRKNYLMLDSRYRNISSQSSNSTNGQIEKFSWTFNLSNYTINGSVNAVGTIRDIVSMHIFPFRIPYTESGDNKYSRISLFIEEFGAQAFIAHENRKFHFMLQSQIDGSFINLLTDQFNDGVFNFSMPITTLENITISFGSPISNIIFDKDRDNCTIDYFSIAPLTKITVGIPVQNKHNLSNGDRVYFSNFDVGNINPSLLEQDKVNKDIKNTINREEGFLITVIDQYNFSIPFDSSNIQNPLPDSLLNSSGSIFSFNVFYGSKRIFLPIELTYQLPDG